MVMRFSVLGPLMLQVAERTLSIPRPRRRAVLAYLLLNANRPVHMERLIDVLWPDAPPSSARDQVHADISALRGSLREFGGDGVITRSSAGYAVAVGPGELDLDDFTRLTVQARALADSDPAQAAQSLREGLALWRGVPLADVRAAFVDGARLRLQEQRIAAQEQLAYLEIQLGRHEEVLDGLAALVAEHPLREGLRAHSMLALYRSGRRADALATARDLRRRLVAEHGLDPGPAVTELERRILRDDPALLPAPENGRVHRQLPPDIGDFVGRAGELAQITGALGNRSAQAVVVAVAGMGGTGKTVLAVRAAYQLAGRYADGCLFLDMHGLDPDAPDAYQAMASILRSLGLPGSAIPVDRAALPSVYRSELAARSLLLVLDNASDEKQIRPLIPPGSCGLLVTSRRVLAGLDEAQLMELGVLPVGDALALLGEVAGAARVAKEPAAARRLVELGGQLPLSVRVIGRRLARRSGLALSGLADRLADERSRLDELAAGDRAVRAVIAVSVDRLEDDARQALRRIGTVPVPSMPSWLVAGLLDIRPPAAERIAERLAADSLITIDDSVGEARYRVHDLIHLYAREQADDGADRDALRRAYQWLHAVAVTADAGLPMRAYPTPPADAVPITAPADPMRWFEIEHVLLFAAIRDCVRRGWHDLAGRLVTTMVNFSGLQAYTENWTEAARLALSGMEGEPGEAELLLGIGGMLRGRGGADEALVLLRKARRLFLAAGDDLRAATAAIQISTLNRSLAKWRVALAAADWAVARLESGPPTVQLGYAHLARGNVLLEGRDMATQARLAFERAWEVFVATGNRAGEGNVMVCLAYALRAEGEPAQAVALFEKGAAVLREVGDVVGELMSQVAIVRLLLVMDDVPAAAAEAGRAVATAEKSGFPRGLSVALFLWGEALQRGGRSAQAVVILARALNLMRELDLPRESAAVLFQLAQARLALGDKRAAQAAATESLEIYTAIDRSEAATVGAWLAEL